MKTKVNGRILLLLWGLLTAVLTTRAESIQNSRIPADAKWLVHLDLENLRGTQLGKFALSQLDEPLGALKGEFKMDLRPVLQKISSITAYGDDYAKGPQANGVLLIKMDAETRQILEGIIAAQMLAAKDESIKKVQQGAAVVYSLKDELHLAIEPDHLVIVSKSQKQIEKARSVLADKTATVDRVRAFSSLPSITNSLILLVVAEGFNDAMGLPPQAKIFQMTDAARLAFGERGDQAFVELNLLAKSNELIQQIQQVVQGMVALVSLSQMENPQLLELTRSLKVTAQEKMLLIKLEYPVAKIMNHLNALVPAVKPHLDVVKPQPSSPVPPAAP